MDLIGPTMSFMSFWGSEVFFGKHLVSSCKTIEILPLLPKWD